ncbi:hypothetical protein JCM18899A_31150 [Nocardioides sp. AN3]
MQLGGGCPNGSGGYKDTAFSPNSNGWNSYVNNQDVGFNGVGTETLYVNGPRNWQVVSNLGACGGCVQTFPASQQLFDNWGSSGLGSGTSATPISSLSALSVNYDETSPGGSANGYEFAPDIWLDGYPWDIMFWVDTNLRCSLGVGSVGEVIGSFSMDGQNWTVHRYGSNGGAGSKYGDEIIVTLDGAGGSGTCAQQPKGTINVKAGLEALASKGFIPASPAVRQMNTGWEITESKSATFTVHDLSYTVTPK